MIRVLVVFGTRPEAIKVAPVIKELGTRGGFETIVCVTAQHRAMLDDVLTTFGIAPDHDLNIMVKSQTPSYVTAAVHTQLEPILDLVRPDWLLVQGDTTTAMAAAMAAFFHKVKVGHIEAGLRTWDKWQPFPEEINRRVADLVSDLHFAPTVTAKENLVREGIAGEDILVTGNTVIDALLDVTARPFEDRGTPLEGIGGGDRRVILLTSHRRESFGEPLRNICSAVSRLASEFPDVQVVYPVHPNPNVTGPVNLALGGIENVLLIQPLDYLCLAHLMKRSHLILTDSGGIQEEAPSLGVPVLVLRDVTERPEGVEAGAAKLVGTDGSLIFKEAARLLTDEGEHSRMAQVVNPYGDGHASERIADALELKEARKGL